MPFCIEIKPEHQVFYGSSALFLHSPSCLSSLLQNPLFQSIYFLTYTLLKPWTWHCCSCWGGATQQLEQVFSGGHLQRIFCHLTGKPECTWMPLSTMIAQMVTGKPEPHQNFRTVSPKSPKFTWLQLSAHKDIKTV